jgi:hypothetical protein
LAAERDGPDAESNPSRKRASRKPFPDHLPRERLVISTGKRMQVINAFAAWRPAPPATLAQRSTLN